MSLFSQFKKIHHLNSKPTLWVNLLSRIFHPGEYVLIMVIPINTLPILNAEGEEIEITIQGGELLDWVRSLQSGQSLKTKLYPPKQPF